MYGARSARQVEAREGIPLPQLNMMPIRKPVYSGANDNHTRVSRGEAFLDEDTRLGSSRGADIRVTNFSGGRGKSRGSVEHVDRHRYDDISPITERRAYRDDLTVLKMVSGVDEAPPRAESGSRFRDGVRSRGERVIRPAAYADDPKLVRNGNYDTLSYDRRIGGLRDGDYLPMTKATTTTSRPILHGFIFECPKRLIAEYLSQKGSFTLPLDDRRFAEQVGPSTKIFMFDSTARELHGVFQAESFSLRVSQDSPVGVRVRVAKECIPLTARQCKDILHDNLYTHSKFSEHLTKEQVMKLLHTFRAVDPARSVHTSLPTSRRISDSGLSHSSEEFHSISDEIVYRKEEWRRGTVDTRSLSGHSYHSQEAARFSSKLPAQILPAKTLHDYEDYGDDEVIEHLPVSTSRLITGSTPYSTSRVKQQSLRTQPASRTSMGHVVGRVGHSELKLAEENWREDIDPRDLLYRKRQALSPSPVEELKRGGLSSSPPWKDMVEEVVGEMYDRPVNGGYKEESTYLSSRRRHHADIDLEIPSQIAHGEPAHLHDVKPKGVRRRTYEDEDEKQYSVSPPKGRRGQMSDDLLTTPNALDDYDDDSRLGSRHIVSASRNDYPLSRTEEKSRPLSNSFSNGKFGKPPSRIVTMKTYSKDIPTSNPISRKRLVSVRDPYIKESSLRGTKAPVLQVKANLQSPVRGRPERVVTMVGERTVTMGDKDNFRSRGNEGFANGGSSSQGRKRKTSVWSRITLPGKALGQKGAVTQGRGRVFDRLGPSLSDPFERRDDTYVNKSKRPRPQQADLEVEDDSERIDNIENSPDALEGEDYLNDDHDAEGRDKETEKAADDLQGWTRKKASVANFGDESGISDHGEYPNAKGGRRKLVRPSIAEGGWKHLEPTPNQDSHAQLTSRSGSMDMDMTNMEAHEAADDINYLAGDHHPLEEDNIMSS